MIEGTFPTASHQANPIYKICGTRTLSGVTCDSYSRRFQSQASGLRLPTSLCWSDLSNRLLISILSRDESADCFFGCVPQSANETRFKADTTNTVKPPSVQCGERVTTIVMECCPRGVEPQHHFFFDINGHKKISRTKVRQRCSVCDGGRLVACCANTSLFVWLRFCSFETVFIRFYHPCV